MTALLVYLAGLLLVAAVAWTVARPFFVAVERPIFAEPGVASRWRKRRDEALQAIREAEFDFRLGKLSETDYHDLRNRLEASAVEAIEALELEPPRGGKEA